MEKTEKSAAEGEKKREEEHEQLLETLPKVRNMNGLDIYFHQNHWNGSRVIAAKLAFQSHFKAKDSDIILATMPKSGTTWLKALTFATINRDSGHNISPLLSTAPHNLIPFFELDLYSSNHSPNLESIPSPRIFATHIPYNSLPSSLKDYYSSKCKIVYLCRNPLDQFISDWHFCSKMRPQTEDKMTLEQAHDNFCRGIGSFGPFWDQVLGYWKASHEMPERVLFLKYEDMKEDIVSQLKMLAQFLDCPFSTDEEQNGVIEAVAKLCSFDNLRDLEVNKTGKHRSGHENSNFFRKGEVGDWVNYLTPSMANRIKNITHEKFEGSGLSFKIS